MDGWIASNLFSHAGVTRAAVQSSNHGGAVLKDRRGERGEDHAV